MNFINPGPLTNLLPYTGASLYFGKVFSTLDSIRFFKKLEEKINWKHDEVQMFGKCIVTKRKTAWYADNGLAYTYSGISHEGLPWNNVLLELKKATEKITGHTYNSCLLNLYHDGAEGMAWHSDDEPILAPHAAIASLSFGAERKFIFKHKKSAEKIELHLENGSLLLMQDETQSHWLHSIPKTKTVISPRINLTFRTVLLA